MAGNAIAPPDLSWPAAFEKEAVRLREAFGGSALRIEHVGSTAVPGLAARPVIDIQVSVADLALLAEWRERLEQLDYVYSPQRDDGSYPFFHRPERSPHDFHLHLCEIGSPEERWNLAFRDYLRVHSDVRDAYADEKRRLARLHDDLSHDSRAAHAAAKSDFIDQVVRRALNEGYGR